MDYNEEKKDKRDIRRSFLDNFRIIFALVLCLFLFAVVQSFFQGFEEGMKNSATGDAIVFEGEGRPNATTEEDGEDEIVEEIVSFENENLKCWYDGGLKKEDLVVFGSFLSGIPCSSGEIIEVYGERSGDCINIYVEDEAKTNLCGKDGKPVIDITLEGFPYDVEAGFPEGFKAPEKNYYWYVLFFLCLVILFFFWREYEMGISSISGEKKTNIKIGRKKKKYEDEKDTFYFTGAPLHDEKKAIQRDKQRKLVEKKIKRDELKKEIKRDSKINRGIKNFNELSEKINDLIIAGKLVEARKKYLELFKNYSEIIGIVNIKNRSIMDEIMEYLCNYLGVLEGIKKPTRKKRVQEKPFVAKEEKVKVSRVKPKLMGMDELNDMKKLIKKKQYEQARQMFYKDSIGGLKSKDVVSNVLEKSSFLKKDKLKEIEIRHDKVLKEGVVNVDKDDYYKFMNGLSLLSKELGKKKRKRRKKN